MVDMSALRDLPEGRSLPWIQPSAWSGYPDSWTTPSYGSTQQSQLKKLIDVAWTCIDLNSSVLASMPVYRMRNGKIIDSLSWMSNPDPSIYSSWYEFAKQLFWDFHLGEAFVLPMAHGSDGYPIRFRVVPPWLVNVELGPGGRNYKIGSMNVTNEILHIRYQSTTDDAHGHGPLEAAGGRQITIGLLQRYVKNLTETGGVPLYWLGIDRKLTESEAVDLMDRWIESRSKYAGHPALVSGGATLNQAKSMSAHDMSLLELTQFNEARVAIMCGVPPFLVGLPGATGSLTYSNIEQLFSFHDRSSLRPKAVAVMTALDSWVTPAPQTLELNRDDYTRPSLTERARAYKMLIECHVMEPPEARAMERLHDEESASRISGGMG
jgi:HK97 family phage portal protein